jgi:hypothetical protein
MRVPHIASLGALAAAAGLAAAQTPTPPATTAPAPLTPPATAPAAPSASTMPSSPMTQAAAPEAWRTWNQMHPQSAVSWGNLSAPPTFSGLAAAYNAPMRGPQVWGGVEYLMWWVKPGPISVPLVNTTIVPEDLASSISAGGVNDRLARTIFGNQNINFDTASGVRFYAGKWFDSCQETGFEASMFFLPQLARGFTATGGTGPNAQPALTVPFNSVGPGPVVGETSAAIAGPFAGTAVIGTVSSRLTTHLWGADGDMLFNMWKGEEWRFDAVGGFKYMDLFETLDFDTSVMTSPFGSTHDEFQTTNRFWGGELGARISGRYARFGAMLTGKVGLGDNVQTLNIRGTSIAPTNFGGAFSEGGLFALSSNIGRTEHGRFSAIPQVIGTLSYDINCHVKTYVGYDFFYWSNVIRPGDQIDRNINPNLAPVFGGSPTGAGLALPARLEHQTAYWAHGISIGLSAGW